VLQCKTPIDFVFTERIKELLMKRSQNNPEYPYAYIVISEMDLLKDRGNTNSMAMTGHRGHNHTGTSSQVGFLFPCKLAFTLHYLDSDSRRMFCNCQSLLIADNSRAFNFDMYAFNTKSEVIVKRQGSISLPEPGINTSDDVDASVGHIQISFEATTWFGFTQFIQTLKGFNINVKLVQHDAQGNEIIFDALHFSSEVMREDKI
jgi:hypothetical protein